MCELFVLETGVDILSRARVRVTYCALLRLSAHAMPRVLALRAICSLSRRENAKTLARSAFLRNYREARSFSLRGGVGLDTATHVHHLIIKQKAHTDV